MNDFISKLHLDDGGILVLGSDGVWAAENPEWEAEANLANLFSHIPYYEYSSAHGAPGCWVSEVMAKYFGGTLEMAQPDRLEKVCY